jgi:hypothetical protein
VDPDPGAQKRRKNALFILNFGSFLCLKGKKYCKLPAYLSFNLDF